MFRTFTRKSVGKPVFALPEYSMASCCEPDSSDPSNRISIHLYTPTDRTMQTAKEIV